MRPLPTGRPRPSDAAVLHLGDCMDFMAGQPDGSYDIIITDPPYEATDLKFDKAGSVPWTDLSRELLRVLKPAGWFFMFGNLVMGSHFLNDWRFKFEYVWVKNRHVMSTPGTVRPWYKHEAIYAFINPALRRVSSLYFDADILATEGRRIRHGLYTAKSQTEFRHAQRLPPESAAVDTIKRHATTVLNARSKGTMHNGDHERTDHPTQKPVSIYETLLQGYCPPDGLALDPFGGSGTMAIAAMNTGRRYHLAEIDPGYHAMIEERVARHVPRLETARRQQTMTAHLQEAAQ